ncbi:MAG: peptidoglycan synthetase [Bacteroidetes bacterium]|nr:peptidoglycan synthetase [Bacteroidota bacterium]
MKKVHFIAIGGSAMHNLALAMHEQGLQVSGSDDEIFEPSRTRLSEAGILPSAEGWFPEKINTELDAVILGMHARADNPELLKAQELGLPVFSYPGYIYEVSRNKKRIVIGGSHGKTSITAMVLHVLGKCGIASDYLVGAQLKGYKTMVKLTKEAPLVLLEGDEYLSSPVERVPKFHLYKPHVAVLSGIAWDHINVFPTFENYVDQFRVFISKIEPGGVLFYYSGDPELQKLAQENPNPGIRMVAYDAHDSVIKNGLTFLKTLQGEVELKIFGTHNLQNLQAAKLVCNEAGVSDADFYNAISSFEGAARRLEKVFEGHSQILFKDFAHSPSKLKATTDAVKQQFPEKFLLACMELHTFSSLNAEFLDEYRGCMNEADKAIVYYNPHTVEHKKLAAITPEQVKKAFDREDLVVCNNSAQMIEFLQENVLPEEVILMMSSGNFDGIKMEELPQQLGLS